MNKDKVTALCTRIKQEMSWVESLNALLVEEKGLLEKRKFAQLEECASKKTELSHQLEESARERMELINSSDQSVVGALAEFLKDCSDDEINHVTSLNMQLAEKLKICRELNSINGQVIANNIYVREEIVNALSGNKENAVSVYNSHGSITSSSENRTHREA